MEFIQTYYPYLVLMLGVYVAYIVSIKRTDKRSRDIKQAAIAAGLGEPVSLHPVIDPALCLGCATCTRVCPEGDILGIINGKAELIEPTHCIGHGACKSACPTDAIRLVFGTAERGVDLPSMGSDFQTNVPGLFIAGELGGMGLIRNAVEQGRQAVESISKLSGFGQSDQVDLIVVGAGPAGIAAALAAKEKGLAYVVVEQDDLGGTVFKYPRGKVVMTAPATLPIVGKVNFREVSKEQLLEFWKKIEIDQDLHVQYRERVESVRASGGGFEVQTSKRLMKSRAVLLAAGRRGTPRELGVPGEDLPKVVYLLIDAEQYREQKVLVVGGGDSALEAAISISQQPGSEVTLAYRGKAFGRARQKNKDAVDAQVKAGKIDLRLETEVKSISKDKVEFTSRGIVFAKPNDAVIVCAGGILPFEFLKAAGIEMVTKYGSE